VELEQRFLAEAPPEQTSEQRQQRG